MDNREAIKELRRREIAIAFRDKMNELTATLRFDPRNRADQKRISEAAHQASNELFRSFSKKYEEARDVEGLAMLLEIIVTGPMSLVCESEEDEN